MAAGVFMTEQDFAAVRRLLAEDCAIVLDPDKQYLVESRLTPLVRRLQLDNLGELLVQLPRQPGDGLRRQIVEAMVNTETSFFRDKHPFEALRTVVLPDLIERRRAERRLHLWCAASSSGQEPYSVALLLREYFPELAGWKIVFVASDISHTMLTRCREGVYSTIELNRGLPAPLLNKYFERQGSAWQIQPSLRNLIDFQEINLAHAWPTLPRMDVILLRNVMIYFDVETKKGILGKVARLLRSDGYLFLGGAETTINLDSSYSRVEPLKAGVYRLVS